MEKLIRIGLSRQVISAGKKILQNNLDTGSKISYRRRQLHCSSVVLTKYFTKEHEWLDVEDGVGTVGITTHAQELLGDIVYIELPEVGAEVAQGKEIGSVESVKAVSEILSPASGEVIESNEEVVDSPELVNKSPEDEGWFVKVKLSDESELETLMNEDEYKAFLINL